MKSKQKSDKKIYITFIVVMAVLYGAGYLIGSLVAKGQRNRDLTAVLKEMKKYLMSGAPLLCLVVTIAMLFAVCALSLSCIKMYKKLQENLEDDDLWDCLEDKLNQPMILVDVMLIINLFFFGCVIWMAEFHSYGRNGGYETAIIIADSILFFVVLVVGMLVPKGLLDIEKKLNPEKRGNVFDFKFNEVWLASCDEAQKLIAYKAAYKAFRDTNFACVVLYVLALMGMFMFKTGLYPAICMCVVMLVNNLSYMLRAAKLERRR